MQLTSHLLAIALFGLLWRVSSVPLPLRLLSLWISGVCLACCFAGLHECSHRTAFRSRRLNDGAAWLLGLLSFYNATFYRRYHQWHHRFTHQPGRDPELDDPVPTTVGAYLLEISGLTWWSGKVRGYARLLWGDLSAVPYLSPELIPQVRRSVRLQFGVYGALLVLSLIQANGFLLWSWLVPLAVGQPVLRLLLLAEHTGCAYSGDALANTRTTLTLAPVRWLMWNMPFHAEHHLYPSLPFHALPAAHRWIGPNLQHLDRGYLRVHFNLLSRLAQLAQPA
ncbi:MAG: fatty acid desaturase [Cyanobacteriota bacterium]|nr:fatty acid desaturase [Cyanobacteriota bacterium]